MELGTVFDLASLTKVVATLPAVSRLLDEGDIRLDDEVQCFLPEFAQNEKEKITIRHLLTHTSGLTAERPFHVRKLSVEQILNEIYKETTATPIGSKVIYSDLGFIMLYKIVEEITRIEFSQLLTNEFLMPLGMTETGYNLNYPQERYATTEYCEQHKSYKRGIVHDENTEAMGGISGHAGLFSTVSDLDKFARMI